MTQVKPTDRAERDVRRDDESAIMNIQTTEQDLTKMRLDTDTDPPGEPGVPGPREDVDRDDSQMSEAASHPLN